MLKIDPDGQAQNLSMMVDALGREIRKIAIISKTATWNDVNSTKDCTRPS
ncbi:MAG TPA: hypothetical protein VFR51_20160 [Pyrinomonadaceae bacterium]|nr:hypothetical protein [Pyrinomonadaceae bacterium]